MLRIVSNVLRNVAAKVTNINVTNSTALKYNTILNYTYSRNFGALSTIIQKWITVGSVQDKMLLNRGTIKNHLTLPVEPINIQTRLVTKFSLIRGRRKTVKAVIDRFYRLDWGIWIRTKAGRKKYKWKRTVARKKRLRQHVFCNATQSTLLDKMVTKYWRRRHYYVDDPYNPYHEREEFPTTRRRPLP